MIAMNGEIFPLIHTLGGGIHSDVENPVDNIVDKGRKS
jgi:hypothetical protein